ncbi:MAG: ABC transporter substrate-binding protein [Anaerolineaceae bacterium]|nr:ABC transporter substrate-binding protein [Anaerolineaceae bacterium]
MSLRNIVFALASVLLLSTVVVAQDALVYPFQYGSLDEFTALTGNSIDSYGEAPQLADMVAAGELPAVAERLPSQPVVVQPLESVGQYGGELVGPSAVATCCGWDVLEMRLQKLFTIDTDLQTIIPNIALSYEANEDSTVYTISLREGHRWSDGEPFTSEDFRFWFEDILGNTELTPSPGGVWAPGGELAQFEVLDETTIRYTFGRSHPGFIVTLASEVGHRGFRPAHYFKPMHADYNEEADGLAAENGFADWKEMIRARLNPYNFTWNLGSETDPSAPTLNTFRFVSEDNLGNKFYERNPYFFKVDVAGNQLPYTDTLRRVLVENLEVQDLKGIAGEYSHYGWGQLASYPTYKENEEAGGYRTALVTYSRGNEYVFMFNFTHEDEGLREIYADVRFRQAMSVAINRAEINDLVYFGLATPSQAAPTPDSAFYEDWMTDYYAQYDPDLANQLLDEMGLDQRDAEGFRLRPNGDPLFINLQVSVPEEAWSRIAELTADYWNAVGVKTNFKLIDSGLYTELRNGNQVDVAAWGHDIVDIGEVATGLTNLRPRWGARASGRLWQDWFNSDGESGMEPPEDIKALWDLGERYLQAPYGSELYYELGNEFYDTHFEALYMIGTIQRPPQPLLFKTNLRNTPPSDTEGLWSWSYRQWVMFMPEQWYFE